MADTKENNYVIGRGRVFLQRYRGNSGNEFEDDERYIGNTTDLNLSFESENLDHFNSDRGTNEKDASVVLQINRTGTLNTDNINEENTALFFFGSAQTLIVPAATVAAETLNIRFPYEYQLGITNTNPMGARGLDDATPLTLALAGGGGTAPVLGTDYEVDYTEGRILPLAGGMFDKVARTEVTAGYSVKEHTVDRVLSGSRPVRARMRYIEDNPHGKNATFVFPEVKITPNGDYSLKAQEWRNIPFTLEIIKQANLEAVYRDGAPIFE